jgi:hypothetical protein
VGGASSRVPIFVALETKRTEERRLIARTRRGGPVALMTHSHTCLHVTSGISVAKTGVSALRGKDALRHVRDALAARAEVRPG